MATVEPGIYRIVNIGWGTVMTVSAENNNTIVVWEMPNQPGQPGQQWLVRRSREGYHISNHVHGQYITVENAEYSTIAYLGCDPTLWEIVPVEEMEAAWKIKLAGHNMLLDPDGGRNGDEIRLHPPIDYNGNLWRLERQEDLPAYESGSDSLGTTEKDSVIVQMAEQLAQKDKQLVEQAGQLANQDRRIADQSQRNEDQNKTIATQNQKIANQEGEIFVLKKQMEEKDQELAQANKEVKYLLARLMQSQEPLYQGQAAGANSPGVVERVQEEVTLLRNEMERMKGLMSQMIDKDNKMPDNMS